jgi:hypothetical protein
MSALCAVFQSAPTWLLQAFGSFAICSKSRLAFDYMFCVIASTPASNTNSVTLDPRDHFAIWPVNAY